MLIGFLLLGVLGLCLSGSRSDPETSMLSGRHNTPPARKECKKCGALNQVAYYDPDNKPECRECGYKL